MLPCYRGFSLSALPAHLKGSPGVGRPVLAPELLELLLQLLLAPPPHHGLGVADGAGEGGVRQLWGGGGQHV